MQAFQPAINGLENEFLPEDTEAGFYGYSWAEHFRWSNDGIHMIGLTSISRATVVALHLSAAADTLLVRSY